MINLTSTQKNIIKILFVEKESSRSILAKKLKLTNAALTLTMKPLLEEGIILESKKDIQRVGRKELITTLNPDYGYFLGVDIRKHHFYFSLMNFLGDVIKIDDDRNIKFKDFYKDYLNNIIAIGITVRGVASLNVLKEKYPAFHSEIEDLGIPYYLSNNVNCLADIYSLYYHDDKNFLLIKYGPGVGSSIYVYGKPLGETSELGHMYYKNNTIEESISYSSILGKELEEDEANVEILKDDEKLRYILHVLSFAIINADSLLSLQKIILSGALLSNEITIKELEKELIKLNTNFDINKLCIYPNYNNINDKKGSLGAFIKFFN